jgi:hypothetical protein
MEEKIYEILKKHKLPLKKREELMYDLLGLLDGSDQDFTQKQIEQLADTIPLHMWIDGIMVDEWWNDGNEAFKEYGKRLIEKGLDFKFIQSMFLDLYSAVSGEFGN